MHSYHSTLDQSTPPPQIGTITGTPHPYRSTLSQSTPSQKGTTLDTPQALFQATNKRTRGQKKQQPTSRGIREGGGGVSVPKPFRPPPLSLRVFTLSGYPSHEETHGAGTAQGAHVQSSLTPMHRTISQAYGANGRLQRTRAQSFRTHTHSMFATPCL